MGKDLANKLVKYFAKKLQVHMVLPKENEIGGSIFSPGMSYHNLSCMENKFERH